jgi:FKBP-type peptidyl-prolyl cis-trans isomerase FklB
MKKPFASLLFSLSLMGAMLAQQSPAPLPANPAPKTQQAAPSDSPFKTQKDKISYALGMNIGNGLRRNAIDVDLNTMLQGIKDGATGAKPQMTDDEIRAALTAFQQDMQAKAMAQMQQAATKNKQEGDAFLAANKTKEGVVTLPSGLQYKIITPGTGPKPTAADTVVCNYRGTLVDGTEFDSSYKRGQAATFGVGRVIKGWTEALQLMPVGSKWQLFIPTELAYGMQPPSEDIPLNATLIFEVELLSIQGKQ